MNDVKNYLNSLNINEKDNIIIAVSGGPDSMCLFNILIKLRKEKKFNIICAHINHSKRAQSNEEKIYVEKFCKQNDVVFEYLKIEKYDKNINFHEQARNIRYNFFDKLVEKYSSKFLFLAHHGDDLIETILMKITRGSNIKGYSGFRIKQMRNNYNIIRPLIYVTKDDILKYLYDNNIKYYIDESNNMDIYTRNRYRKYILPFLKKEDKNIHKKYMEFGNCLYQQELYIQKIVNKKYMEYVIDDVLKIDKIKKEDFIIQERIIYIMLSDVYKENINKITQEHIKSIINLLNNNKPNININLPNNFLAIKEYNKFYISKNIKQDNDFNCILLDEINTDNYIIKIISEDNDTSNYTIRLNSSEINTPLYVRNRRNGDLMEVKGLNGTKKVKDVFIDSKIPKQQRNQVPILVDQDGKVLCVFGIKKSKYDKQNNEFYDIIIKCIKKEEESYEK